MILDARFQDGDDAPLRLIAQELRDLEVMAALVQDAVFPITEMTYAKRQHRFALLLNRFRWEDTPAAKRTARPFERVRSLLVFETVLGVRSQNIDRGVKDAVLSLLSIGFAPRDQGGVDRADRGADHPVGLDARLVQRLVHAPLVSAQRTAALQHQHHLSWQVDRLRAVHVVTPSATGVERPAGNLRRRCGERLARAHRACNGATLSGAAR